MNNNTLNKLTPLLIAAGAVVFINTIEPVIQTVGQTAQTWLARKINKWQIDMQLDNREGEAAAEVISPSPSVTQAIGFSVPDKEDEGVWYDGKWKGRK